jgi:hypothetical protein
MSLLVKPVLKLLFLWLLLLISGFAAAQEEDDVVAQFRRTVFKLQQEMLELKDTLDRQTKELQAQKEGLSLEVERLNAENQKYRKQLLEMDSQLLQMEDKIAASSLTKLGSELRNLSNFHQAVVLDSMEQLDQSEKLILDIINQPQTNLPKDLLILFLAQQKKRHQRFEESISYYSTLLSEFFGSPYFTQAIFEMSDALAAMGNTDQQITLLAQLASLSDTDPFSIKAVAKLKELGAEPLFEEEVMKQDASSDVRPTRDKQEDRPESLQTDATGDTLTQTPQTIIPVDPKNPVPTATETGIAPAGESPVPDSTADSTPVIQQSLPQPAP